MASNRMMRREAKRIKKQRPEKRAELRKQLKNPDLDLEKKFEILAQFQKLGRDSSATRRTRRCRITGRARGVERKFEVCRNKLRELAMQGYVPGLTKASW